MPQVRVVKITFDTELRSHEVPAFRGAIIHVVGREHVAFHHHVSDDRLLYKYPVIQYKSFNKRASIVCIEDGVDEIHHFFSKTNGEIRLGRGIRPVRVESVKINKFQVQVNESFETYRLSRWLPLNDINFKKYQALTSAGDRIQFLEKVIIGNMLSFAKGLAWTVEQPIKVDIFQEPKQQWVKHKGSKLLAFDLDFRTNMSLPYDIGLGKGASTGYGTVTKKR